VVAYVNFEVSDSTPPNAIPEVLGLCGVWRLLEWDAVCIADFRVRTLQWCLRRGCGNRVGKVARELALLTQPRLTLLPYSGRVPRTYTAEGGSHLPISVDI